MLGVVTVLVLYWAVHDGRLSTKTATYSLGNALGAGLIAFSLCFDFNWAAMVIEVAWVSVSLWGFWKHRQTPLLPP